MHNPLDGGAFMATEAEIEAARLKYERLRAEYIKAQARADELDRQVTEAYLEYQNL